MHNTRLPCLALSTMLPASTVFGQTVATDPHAAELRGVSTLLTVWSAGAPLLAVLVLRHSSDVITPHSPPRTMWSTRPRVHHRIVPPPRPRIRQAGSTPRSEPTPRRVPEAPTHHGIRRRSTVLGLPMERYQNRHACRS